MIPSTRETEIIVETEYGFYGSFHEVRPAELIVQTFTFDGMPDGVRAATTSKPSIPTALRRSRAERTWSR